MARAPAAAADPAMPADMMAGEGQEAMMGEEAAPTETCVVSVCKTPEGGYKVYAGAPPADGMPEQEDMAEDAATYDGIGPALHRVMEIMQDDAEGADSQGGAEAQFNAGFEGEGAKS